MGVVEALVLSLMLLPSVEVELSKVVNMSVTTGVLDGGLWAPNGMVELGFGTVR